MPAEKCGNTIAFDVSEEGMANSVKSLVVSSKAYRMLQKIRHKFPDFDPLVETEIWLKAYNMGLTEDE